MQIEELKTRKDFDKVLRRFNLNTKLNISHEKIAKALLKAEIEGMNKPGDCETCRFISWDGELGTIQCCDKDVTERDNGLEVDETDELYPIGECPLWESNAPLSYCKKHHKWYSDNWELACPSCYEEYVQKQAENNPHKESK